MPCFPITHEDAGTRTRHPGARSSPRRCQSNDALLRRTMLSVHFELGACLFPFPLPSLVPPLSSLAVLVRFLAYMVWKSNISKIDSCFFLAGGSCAQHSLEVESDPKLRQAGGPQVALPVPPPPPQSWPPWLPLGGRGSRPRSRQGDGTGFRSRWPRSSGQEPRWRLRAGRGGGGGGNRRPGVWGVRRGMQESLRWGRTLRQGVFQ